MKAKSGPPAGKAGKKGLPAIVWVWIGWAVFWSAVSGLARILPPEPAAPAMKAVELGSYVNDFAGLLSPQAVQRLSTSLAQFEQQTSTQLAIAVYPRLPDGPVEAFTLRAAELSRLGRKGLDNGAILSIFAKDKVARLEVGYGLEGVLPDIEAHRILESVLAPAWNGGDPDAALTSTASALMDLVRDAYQSAKMPGRLRVFWRQLGVEIPRLAARVVPTLIALPTEARIAIAFFGSFLLMGIWDGFAQARRLLRNAWLAASNMRAGRPVFGGTSAVQGGSMIDTVKVFLFLGFLASCAVGIVLVAGSGAFGGAGSMLRW